MATIEALPILVLFVMLVAFMFGSFGIIHTGILHSIAARNYAMETFRHRSNLVYFRDDGSEPFNFAKIGNRFHGIAPENYTDVGDGFLPTQRSISMVMTTDPVNEKNAKVHFDLTNQVKDGVRVRENVAVNPVWIKVQYGICMDARCGD